MQPTVMLVGLICPGATKSHKGEAVDAVGKWPLKEPVAFAKRLEKSCGVKILLDKILKKPVGVVKYTLP